MTPHPSERDLERYVRGDVPAQTTSDAIATHAAECANCAGAIAFERRMRGIFSPPTSLSVEELGTDATFHRVLRGVERAAPTGGGEEDRDVTRHDARSKTRETRARRSNVHANTSRVAQSATPDVVTIPRTGGAAQLERRFPRHVAIVEHLIASVGRSSGLRGAEAEEFASWVYEQLCDDDGAILRKWRGESTMRTYLHVIVAQLANEFRVKRWGRWRPSAEALRRGPVAVALERFTVRDGLSLAEAGERLRARGETTASDRELAAEHATIPVRAYSYRSEWAAAIAAASPADEGLAAEEHEAAHHSVVEVLRAAIAQLAAEEQTVLRFLMLGRGVAEAARALGTSPRRLYRVRDRALRELRNRLLDAGLTEEQGLGLVAAIHDGAGRPLVSRTAETGLTETEGLRPRDPDSTSPSHDPSGKADRSA